MLFSVWGGYGFKINLRYLYIEGLSYM